MIMGVPKRDDGCITNCSWPHEYSKICGIQCSFGNLD